MPGRTQSEPCAASGWRSERVLWPDSLPEELRSLLPAQARHPAGKDDDGDDPPPPKPTLRRIK